MGFSKIETLISLLNLEIDISDIEAISSKIIINDYFNVFSVSDLLSYKDREENFIKKRFCFDLDNTLVTYPKIKGDYSTVEPIVKNIELELGVKLLIPSETFLNIRVTLSLRSKILSVS